MERGLLGESVCIGFEICPPGMIKEVAEAKVGGSENLQRAIARKAVQVIRDAGGMEFYYFPEHVRGFRESEEQIQCATRAKDISAESFEVFDEMLGMCDEVAQQHQARKTRYKNNGSMRYKSMIHEHPKNMSTHTHTQQNA